MKKILLLTGLFITIIVGSAVAADKAPETGKFDGNFVMQGKASYQADQVVTYYIIGVVEAIKKTKPEIIEKFYGQDPSYKIAKTVKDFYLNIPEQRDREVTDLILAGCLLK